MSVALALAQGSSHPLAQALARGAEALGVRPAAVAEVREVPGHGIEGVWDGTRVRLGRADWVGAEAGEVTATTLRIGGRIPVSFAFAFADSLRPGAEALVGALLRQGMQVYLVSGDVEGAVKGLASRLGIPVWHAGARPEEKAAHVRALAGQGRRVLMVGDGLNDTAALAEALVSVSPASALDAARAASDIVLLGRDLSPVEDALRISRQAVRRMKENFYLSAVYNVLSVPVALIGLATPLLAALAMSLSSVTVTVNALRLK